MGEKKKKKKALKSILPDSLDPIQESSERSESSLEKSPNQPVRPKYRAQRQQPTSETTREMNTNDEEAPFFDYDNDDADDTTVVEEVLTWRSDPAISLSDWKLNVVNRETRQTETYHVHKNVLAVGPRKNEYFVRLFARGSGERTHTTEVHLENAASKVVPQWLDYLYEDALTVDTPSATGLRHLAQYFGIKVLYKKVMAFIDDDISMETVLTYYRDAVNLDDTKIQDLTAAMCAEHVLEIDIYHPLLFSFDPAFLRRLVASVDRSSDKLFHVSRLVGAYCEENQSSLDDQDFLRLTDERVLPFIDRRAALKLMEIEADLVTPTMNEITQVSSLQRRCIDDLVKHWKDLSEMDQTSVVQVCRKLPSAVVSELLTKSLGEAKNDVAKLEKAVSDAAQGGPPQRRLSGGESSVGTPRVSARVKKEYEAKLSAVKNEYEEALRQMQEQHEAELNKLKAMVADKDKYLTEYWDELKRFQRLPNQPDGKLGSSGMMAKPTKMPVIGNQPAEGSLFIGRKSPSKHPLFYYNCDMP